MAQITVSTSQEERNKVLKVIVERQGKVTPVSTIAAMAGIKQSRARYAIIDLIDAGIIRKVPHRAFNKHYVRYSYEVMQ